MIDQHRNARAARALGQLMPLVVARLVPLSETIAVAYAIADLPRGAFIVAGSRALS